MAANLFNRPENGPTDGDTPPKEGLVGSRQDAERGGIEATAEVWPVYLWSADGAVVQIGEEIAVCARCNSLMISPSSEWEWGSQCGTCSDLRRESESAGFGEPRFRPCRGLG